MSWRKSHTRRKRLIRDGINLTIDNKSFHVRLGPKWKLNHKQVEEMNALPHIQDYVLHGQKDTP